MKKIFFVFELKINFLKTFKNKKKNINKLKIIWAQHV